MEAYKLLNDAIEVRDRHKARLETLLKLGDARGPSEHSETLTLAWALDIDNQVVEIAKGLVNRERKA